MDKRLFFLFVLIGAILLLAACGGAEESAETNQVDTDHAEEDEHMDEAMAEHMHMDPPHEFESLTNPVAGDKAAIVAGQQIFETNCVTCHGPEGHGDGPAAEGLDPKPAKLADAAMMRDMSDGYLFWRVSEGGAIEPFNSAMPSWKATLTEDQIWQVISYLPTLSENE